MLGASLAKVGVLAVGGKDQRSSDTRWKCRAVETVEKSSKPKRTFPPFPPRLEISQKTRDSHIPTALRAVPCQEEQKPPLDTADLLMDAVAALYERRKCKETIDGGHRPPLQKGQTETLP